MTGGSRSGRRVVVVSPHFDDAVLSLGATMASWSRGGSHVTLLTVLGCDPDSLAPAGGWDARAGFETEAAAARARRQEDRRACSVVGASPVWLPFGSLDYDRHGDDDAVRGAVRSAIDGADAVLLPGSPLTHPDHAWLVRMLVDGALPCDQLGFYAEQPYTHRKREPTEPLLAPAGAWPGGTPILERVAARDWLAKLRAARCYRSQLPLLGLSRGAGAPLIGLVWSDVRRGGEAVAWAADG